MELLQVRGNNAGLSSSGEEAKENEDVDAEELLKNDAKKVSEVNARRLEADNALLRKELERRVWRLDMIYFTI